MTATQEKSIVVGRVITRPTKKGMAHYTRTIPASTTNILLSQLFATLANTGSGS